MSEMTIKNGDMPAMPMFDINAKPGVARDKDSGFEIVTVGLTKREMMAMHIMTGLCSKYGAAFDTDTAQDAVRMADFLLAELERTK